jgi:hypothetical protein
MQMIMISPGRSGSENQNYIGIQSSEILGSETLARKLPSMSKNLQKTQLHFTIHLELEKLQVTKHPFH